MNSPVLSTPAQPVLVSLAATATTETLAETVIAFAVLDGLLEAIEWANDGVAADEPACMWLSTLRWVRAFDGSVPEGAPESPARWTDAHFRAIAAALTSEEREEVSVHPDTQSLRLPEMSTPSRPFARKRGPETDYENDDAVQLSLRSFVLALLPDADGTLIRRLTRDAAALTHGAEASYAFAQSVGAWANALFWPELRSANNVPHDRPTMGVYATQVETAQASLQEPGGVVVRSENPAHEALLKFATELAQRWDQAAA